MSTKLPQPLWQVLYGGKNITGNLFNHGVRIDYQEHIAGKASTLQISVEDSSKAFQNNLPTSGTAIQLAIGYSGAPLTSCGLFEVDEWDLQGPPDIFVLKCIQAGISRSLRTPKSVAWEGMTLVQIAAKIASIYNMTVVADAVTPDIPYQRITQRLESDLAFLHRVANLHNYEFNIRGNQMVFYNRTQLEAAAPVGTLLRSDCIRYKLGKQHVGDRSYQNCTVTYLNPVSKAIIKAIATDANATSADSLNLVMRVENQQQAVLRANAHLHSANMQQMKGDIEIPGTMVYRAGNALNTSGFGAFDGIKWIIEEAKHTITRQGYTTNLKVRNVITGTVTQLISDRYEDR